jgi:hypothetical protein
MSLIFESSLKRFIDAFPVCLTKFTVLHRSSPFLRSLGPQNAYHPSRFERRSRWQRADWIIVFATLIAIEPVKSAFAYVDPNSVGPLYQFLFPLLIAIASGFAVLKRKIVQLWNLLPGVRKSGVEDDPASDAD